MSRCFSLLIACSVTLAACASGNTSHTPNNIDPVGHEPQGGYKALGAQAQPLQERVQHLPPPASPAVEPPLELRKEMVKTSKSEIETSVRQMLASSDIRDVSIELKSVENLNGNAKIIAGRELTTDSPVWFVTVNGTIRWNGMQHFNSKRVPVTPTGKTMRLVVSALDGKVITQTLEEPQYVEK